MISVKVRTVLALLCVLMGISCGALAEESFYEEMPYYLRFTQTMESETVERKNVINRTYPDTMNDTVDAVMRELVDAMAEKNRALPEFADVDEAVLDVGAVINRSGTSLLSFLTLAEVSSEWRQTSVDFDSRAYDMETGRQVLLTDMLKTDSNVWQILADAVRSQLGAAFPALEADAQALDQLCSAESLQQAAFSFGAARLTLTYRADALYPGKNTLLHVYIPYQDIRHAMTEYGQQQTDNSRFRLVALTFDDGPAGKYTERVLNMLRQYGGQATFFTVGTNILDHADMIAREQDSMHSVQSHSYSHSYPNKLTRDEAREEKAQLSRDLEEVIGLAPTMMRAPGGREHLYIVTEIGYPLMHWSLASQDSGSDAVDKIARRVIRLAQDGDVVLMHDLNPYCWRYAKKILADFAERGILCVTVEELFLDAGITLEPHKVYYSTYREPALDGPD